MEHSVLHKILTYRLPDVFRVFRRYLYAIPKALLLLCASYAAESVWGLDFFCYISFYLAVEVLCCPIYDLCNYFDKKEESEQVIE